MGRYFIGIDLGTSSVRAFLIDFETGISTAAQETYETMIPQSGYAEQDPEIWYQKTCECIRRAIQATGVDPKEIEAVSFSGQMHGLVALNEEHKPVMNAVVWLDQRSGEAINEIYEKLGAEFITKQTQNRIAAGFMVSTLYWLKTRRPELYAKVRKVFMPKDYVKFRLSGAIITDYSDAAGSLAFDNVQLRWSETLLNALGLDLNLMPECAPSTKIVGHITAQAAADTGLCESTCVVNGGADQCMMAVGNGIVEDGVFASNIGTAGQISTTVRKPVYDPALRTNTFAHAVDHSWNLMGACLNSGISLKWITKQVLHDTDYDEVNRKVAASPIGGNGLFFLPYLTGERTPHMDSKAKGVFFGLTLAHDGAALERAVMEGVVFALKDCLNVLLEMGVECKRIIAAGGGARSDVWLQMQADIFERPVYRSASDEQACLGAAITAAVGVGKYKDYMEACAACVKEPERAFYPIAENVEVYRKMYPVYRELYRANRHIFSQIGEIFAVK